MDQQQLHDLLERYQQDTATPKEKAMVEAYMLLSENENRQFLSNTEKEEIQQRIWQRLENDSQDQEPDAKVIPLNRRWRYIAVACGILATVCGLTYLMRFTILDTIDPIAVKTISTGSFETRRILLPDSSIVTLGQNSSLSFKERYRGKKRSVSLDGLAFFDIRSNPSMPFTVEGQNLNIDVLGTSFEVNENKVHAEATVAVVTGKVQVSGANNKYAILEPGQKVSYDNKSGEMQVRKVNADTIALWTSNRYIFNDTPLTVVLQTISKHNNIIINIDKPIHTSDYTFAGSFGRDESIREMLDVICFSAGLRYSMPDSAHVVITK